MKQPTTAKLRHEINQGRGTDNYRSDSDSSQLIDPPAAPLGTDDEAAGTPPSRFVIKQAYEQEIFGRRVNPAQNREDYAVPIFVGVVATVVSFVAFAIWLA